MSSPAEAYKQSSRVEALDSARGWAILGVVAIHVSQVAPLPSGILHSLATNGDMGVELFYVLSAFSLIMMMHARTIAGLQSSMAYFIRRLFRIAPMFWIVLLLSTVLFFGKQTFWSPEGIGWTEVALTAVFAHGIRPDVVNAVIPGGWSVAIEVMFYLLLPVLYRYTRTVISGLMWLLISVGVYFLFGSIAQTYFDQTLQAKAQHLSGIYSWYMSLPAQLPVFIMGIVAFQVVHEELLKPIYAYAIAGVGGLLLIGSAIPPEEHMLPRHFLWGGVFAFFIIANVQRPLYLFDNPLMRIVGRISYSTYLLHFIVLIYVRKAFGHATFQPEIKFALLYFVVMGITYFLASWTYRVIELPGMKLGSAYSRQFEVDSRKRHHEQ